VVAALIARPDALRLEGHVREITALFTDVEGFTAMTARAQPHALISALDRYFDGLCAIIIAHGGMVDKIVGDAVHAMFNAPLDVPDHADQAIACAEALAAFSEAFRAEPAALALGFGRTRIGLETGPAIVGDVGGRRKLDYTAHGDAVNAAARLEAANKALATTVAIGAGAAARTARSLRPLGPLMLRGRDGAEPVFTLWPADMDEAQRQSETALLNAALAGDRSARTALAAHAQRRAEDPALQALVTRLACLHGPDPSSDEADEIADEKAAHARVEQLDLK
jgi:adenylate cyclase